ncbi:hypothetical protein FRX31_023897, partial [Thalictrum thalictroides]
MSLLPRGVVHTKTRVLNTKIRMQSEQSKNNDAFSKPKSGSVESNDRGTTNNTPFSKPKSSFVQSKDNSSRSSIAMSKPKPTTSEVQEYNLALGDKGNIVAKATVFERKGADEKLHSVPLGEAYQRVSIHTILDGKNGKTLLPVPLNDADIMTIGSSIGTFVAWPKEWIIIGNRNSNICNGK